MADPALAEPGPYETAGLLRAYRGVPPPQLLKMFRMRGTRMMKLLQKARFEELKAEEAGLEIHDERIYEE